MTGNNAAFSFVTTAVSVMEEDGEVVEICIRLDLTGGVAGLGCRVTATLDTLNGNNASMFIYLDLINGLQSPVHYIVILLLLTVSKLGIPHVTYLLCTHT